MVFCSSISNCELVSRAAASRRRHAELCAFSAATPLLAHLRQNCTGRVVGGFSHSFFGWRFLVCPLAVQGAGACIGDLLPALLRKQEQNRWPDCNDIWRNGPRRLVRSNNDNRSNTHVYKLQAQLGICHNHSSTQPGVIACHLSKPTDLLQRRFGRASHNLLHHTHQQTGKIRLSESLSKQRCACWVCTSAVYNEVAILSTL
jgi:hypothetical protein